MIHAGMGASHVNHFLNTIYIPGIHHRTVKQRKREVGVCIQQVAKKSCRRALLKEVGLSGCENETPASGELVPVFIFIMFPKASR